MAYQFLPEMQGLTDIQSRDLVKNYDIGRAGLARQYKGQSSGAYYNALGNMQGGQAQGLSDIERTNMYQNALLGREERLTKEGRDWQKEMSDEDYKRKLEMMRMQRQWQQEDALSQGLGQLVGMGATAGLGWLGAGAGLTLNPLEKRFSGLVGGMNDTQLMKLFGLE